MSTAAAGEKRASESDDGQEHPGAHRAGKGSKKRGIPPPEGEATDRADLLTKGVAAVTLGAYVLGAIAIRFYLETLDVPAPDLEAFKAAYVYTGLAIVLGPLAIGALLFFAITEQRPRRLARRLGRVDATVSTPRSWRIGVGGLVWLITTALLGATLWAAMDTSDERIPSKITVAGIAATAGVMAVSGLFVVRRRHKRKGDELSSGWAFVIALIFFAISSVGMALWFGGKIYGHIPEQFGGGQATPAALIFTEEGVAAAKQAGIQFEEEPNSRRSLPVVIVTRDGDYYAVRPSDGDRIVQIRKTDVSGLSIDTNDPAAYDIQTRQVKTLGAPGFNQALVLTYTEDIDASTLASRWEGNRLPVMLSIEQAPRETNILRAERISDGEGLNLGRVILDSEGPAFIPATLETTAEIREERLIIDISRFPGSAAERRPSVLSWKPSSEVTDLFGNAIVKREIEESARGSKRRSNDPDLLPTLAGQTRPQAAKQRPRDPGR